MGPRCGEDPQFFHCIMAAVRWRCGFHGETLGIFDQPSWGYSDIYIYIIIYILVGGLEHEFYDFPYIGNVIIPGDELIFFRGVGIPPTIYIYIYMYHLLCNQQYDSGCGT